MGFLALRTLKLKHGIFDQLNVDDLLLRGRGIA